MVSLQSNVNLDALLEKMGDELEKAKRFGEVGDFKKAEECLKIAEPFILEIEKLMMIEV